MQGKIKRMAAMLLAGITALCFGGFSGMSLETGSGELLPLQQFLLGIDAAGSRDCNADGVVDGMDLALLRQEMPTEIQDGYEGFVQTDGRLLTDEAGKTYTIKGMAYGNDVWSNPSNPPKNSHMAGSYQELAEMGFNTVRFYLNYGLFESDSDPYTYRDTGFEWLDQNIAWAKAAGIRLVLNMHYPQGGYQSQGNGKALWTEPENQKRLSSLWAAIAKHCADETTILGYGLVNEPVVAAESGVESLALWQSVAQQITDDIRTVDTNHMIFVERMCAAQNPDTGATQWQNFNTENNYVAVDDDNVVYEFHYYDPHAFTHQGFDWAGTAGNDVTYPDDAYLATVGNAVWSNSTFSGDSANLADGEWQYLESGLITPKGDGTQVICLVMQAEALGTGGIARADDVKLDEYDENGDYVQTIYANTFDKNSALNFWSSNNSGRNFFTLTAGHDAAGCLTIQGTTDDANCSTAYIKPVAGHSYQASGYFQVVGADAGATVRPRVDLWDVDGVDTLNRSFLEKSFAQNITYSAAHNVPVYCGEFGAGIHCFENDRGGDRWLSDVLDIFEESSVNFNYHAYIDGSFGLYTSTSAQAAGNRNEALYDLFCEKLA